MSKIKEYIMSTEEDYIPPDFDDVADYHAAMEQMSFDRIVSDTVNLMLTYGYAAVIRDIDARYAVANLKIWGKH